MGSGKRNGPGMVCSTPPDSVQTSDRMKVFHLKRIIRRTTSPLKKRATPEMVRRRRTQTTVETHLGWVVQMRGVHSKGSLWKNS